MRLESGVAKILLAMLFASPAIAQLRILSAGEVLRNLGKYSGKKVAVAGQMHCNWSIVDRTCYLAAVRCETPGATADLYAAHSLLLTDGSDSERPNPPSAFPPIAGKDVIRKLSSLRKVEALGWHKERRYETADGKFRFAGMVDVKDEWGFAYGLLLTARKDCAGDEIGCGGFEGAPAALVVVPDSVRTYEEYGGKLRRAPE